MANRQLYPPPVEFPPEFDPSAMKLTRGTSCVLCQQRKVRCDKKKPCANCVKARVECRVVPPQPPRRRKKRLQEKDLYERLKKYEALLAENGISVDPIGKELKSNDPHAFDEVADLENDFEGLHTSPDGSQASHQKASSHRPDTIPYKWFLFHREFRASEELLKDSSDEDEVEGSAVHRAFDQMYDRQDGFPFIVGSNRENSVTHYHPSPVQIFRLWQVFITNVNPLLKITHIPTTQGLIIEASSNLETVPKNVEALLFSIYIMALNTMDEKETLKLFAEPKRELLARFHKAGQQALINAGFMRTTDMIVLQAYILFLIAIRMFIDPRQVFCYVGIAVRIGQRMGLHRDGSMFGLSPFEIEQRRRLWWVIVSYDRRIGEMTGSTVTALSAIGDCKLPMNLNDADLHVGGKEFPTPHEGPTEMLFTLIRAELAMAISTDASKDQRAQVDRDDPIMNRPMSMVRMAGPGGRAYTLDGFFAHIEGTYLRYCDQKVPLHFFTLIMTRQALCKMRVVSFLIRMANGGPGAVLSEQEREQLFEEAIQMIEYDNIVQSAESLKGYKWFTFLYFPFPAYMFLVNELRRRTTGPIVDRAWEAIAENHELRGLMNTLHNPMHLAFGNLFVKAWDARDASLKEMGMVQQAPGWIDKLRARAETNRKTRTASKRKADAAAAAASAANDPASSVPQLGPLPESTEPGTTYQASAAQGPPPTGAGAQQHQQQQQFAAASSQSPEGSAGSGMMVTPPGDYSFENSVSQMMTMASDPGGEFGGMNWGFFMQGYDVNSFAAGYPGPAAGFGGAGYMGADGVQMPVDGSQPQVGQQMGPPPPPPPPGDGSQQQQQQQQPGPGGFGSG